MVERNIMRPKAITSFHFDILHFILCEMSFKSKLLNYTNNQITLQSTNYKWDFLNLLSHFMCIFLAFILSIFVLTLNTRLNFLIINILLLFLCSLLSLSISRPQKSCIYPSFPKGQNEYARKGGSAHSQTRAFPLFFPMKDENNDQNSFDPHSPHSSSADQRVRGSLRRCPSDRDGKERDRRMFSGDQVLHNDLEFRAAVGLYVRGRRRQRVVEMSVRSLGIREHAVTLHIYLFFHLSSYVRSS